MKREELADAFAKAMNLLNHLRAMTDAGRFEGMREENEFHSLSHVLPDSVRPHFYDNSTINAADVLAKR